MLDADRMTIRWPGHWRRAYEAERARADREVAHVEAKLRVALQAPPPVPPRDPIADLRADFERTLTVVREENSMLRRMVETAAARVDALTTELVRSLAVAPAAHVAAPEAHPRPRIPTSPDPVRGLGNVFDTLKLGDPDGEFASASAASLMAAEDDDGAAAAA